MKTVIVYESMFGNTEQFAQEIAEGLAGAGAETTLVDVRNVHAADLRGCDLLVIGAPTHAFSLSRPSTREDAVRQGAEPARATLGIREWLPALANIYSSLSDRPLVALFDTRVEKVRRLPGSAAKRAAHTLRAQGFTVVDRPTSFYVADLKGPAASGEMSEAHTWAAHLFELMTARSTEDAS
jgi:hypothetical protein